MNNFLDFKTNMYGDFFGLNPNDVKGQSNTTNFYYTKYLFNKIYSVFDINLNDTDWKLNAFRYSVFRYGSNCAYNHKIYGWILGYWTPRKFDIYMNPVEWNFHVFNATVDKTMGTMIGTPENSVIFNIFDDYSGFYDLVCATSELMANCEKTMNVALMNANVNLMGEADSLKHAEELKVQYSEATKGKPLVIIKRRKKTLNEKSEPPLYPFTQHDTLTSADKILTSRRTILNNFLTEIGIKNANFQKKERLITDEVNANNQETSANVTIALDNLTKCFDKFNKLSGKNISVDLNFDYLEEENAITINEGGDNNV